VVRGDPVYAGFGRKEDFDRLKQMGVSMEGKIAIIRYGEVFRGNVVKLAGLSGAIGAILYSDPAEVAQEGTDAAHTYPNTDYMPDHGVQRGTTKNDNGDSLTPFYPSKPDLYSTITVDDLKKDHVIPSIPAIPMGYADIYNILSQMGGDNAPSDWQGGLNFTYKLGPGMLNSQKLEIEVHSTLEIREIQNVVGYLYGEKERDRYIILCNHFDAWVYGSIDPNSGTAMLSEVARAMKEAKDAGSFKPLRTLMFVNWDAEEYGLSMFCYDYSLNSLVFSGLE
jgi:hypothetical protein